MRKSFTLVEIMIVVAIIALLAAIAIPNLLRARVSAQESAAAAALHTIAAAEIQYRATNPTYGSLSDLGSANPPYIDSTLASGTKQGYNFAVTIDSTNDNFFATAVPQKMSAAHTFYIDEDGVLCRSEDVGIPAPNAHIGSGCPSGFREMQ
ncbi:MAG: prepilin-type N-terminal cleavage/methylation domain-containing protein [Candidatus Omnitrophica bacterium]|nr:prepilin-type N-terminal cleavage/methylation domain-containing protein [Candidatus Omnitrophota bacterium]